MYDSRLEQLRQDGYSLRLVSYLSESLPEQLLSEIQAAKTAKDARRQLKDYLAAQKVALEGDE